MSGLPRWCPAPPCPPLPAGEGAGEGRTTLTAERLSVIILISVLVSILTLHVSDKSGINAVVFQLDKLIDG
jgi:hypothetical protein